MLNLFKSGGYVKDESLPTAVQKVSVEEIHKEFLTACDQIMEEVNTTLAKTTIDKSKRLMDFGFQLSTDIANSQGLIRKGQIADIIKKYQISHPTNKVITSESVQAICEKYSLVHAEVHRFKGFVPEKNLRELERFPYPDEYFVMRYSEWGTLLEISTHKDQKEAQQAAETSHGFVSTPKLQLTICAPQKDMHLYHGEKFVEGKIVSPDPVVLFPIENSCYLIVTAWGEESSDPLVVNEKMN